MTRWQKIIKEFEPLTVIVGDWKAEFDYWEDGHKGGFYIEEDPDSVPVLHVTVYNKTKAKGWVQVKGASWATRFPVDTTPGVLLHHCLEIIESVKVYKGELKLLFKYNHWIMPDEPEPVKPGPKQAFHRKVANRL